MAKANDFSKRLEGAHYMDGSHWEFATVSPPDQRREYYDALDGRAAWFYEARKICRKLSFPREDSPNPTGS